MSFLRQGSFLPGINQNITTSGTSQTTNAVSNNATIVRVVVTENTYVELGISPVATTASMLMPAGAIEFFAVTPGETKIAFLQQSTSGIAGTTELAQL